MSQAASTSPRTIVYKATQRRTFKACRTCRLQKARCIIDGENPPCKRCRATGRDCVFDQLGSVRSGGKRGQSTAEEEGGQNDKRPRYPDLEKEVTQIRGLANGIRRSPGSSPQPSDNADLPTTQSAESLHSPTSDRLERLQLEAPITAVHAMTSTSLPPSPASLSIEEHSTISASPNTTKLTGQPAPSIPLKYDDVVSQGLIRESEARKLFQLYMANANVFLPFFDSTVDTFEVLRHRSAFCFTVILAIALRADHPRSDPVSKKCFAEAESLAARSLFAASTKLETVQGMILLSAHAKRNWFAINHAYQMGKALQLPDLLAREGDTEDDQELYNKQFRDRRSVRRIRTALILHQVEQEVAGGTARQSIGKPVKSSFLSSFLGNALLCTRDMRIVANVEVVQLRAHLLKELEVQDRLDGNVQANVDRFEHEINTWFDRWDSVLQDQDYGLGSFQRSSIRLQRDYAFIIICSAMISKISEGNTERIRLETMTDEFRDLVEITLARSIKILDFITEDNDYKWYLQWAPTYSALFPAFTAALAFRLAKMRPGYVDWGKLQSSFASVADILGEYPYQTYSNIILNLATLTASYARAPRKPTSTSVLQGSENSVTQKSVWGEGTTSQQAQIDDEVLKAGESGTHLANQCEAPTEDFGWPSDSILQGDFQEGSAAAGDDELGMYASFGMPDNSFDFNLFAASVQDYMDIDESETR